MNNKAPIKKYIILFILFFLPLIITAKEKKNSKLDSIITYLSSNANLLQHNTQNYEAELYIKGTINVIKRNILLKSIPYCSQIPKNKDLYFIETWGTLLYTAPYKYTQTINHFNSNNKGAKK